MSEARDAHTQQEIIDRIIELLSAPVEAICEAWTALASAVREATRAIMEWIGPFVTGYAIAAARHPKWVRLSLHAKKARTRKKWRNALHREAMRLEL